jgi:hypothetical protein
MAVHGKTGFVTLTSATICATSWTLDRSLEEVDVTTFCSTGDFKEYIQGFKEATGSFTTLSSSPDYFGSTGVATFGNEDVTFSATILITKAASDNKVDGRYEVNYDFRATGPVTISE